MATAGDTKDIYCNNCNEKTEHVYYKIKGFGRVTISGWTCTKCGRKISTGG